MTIQLNAKYLGSYSGSFKFEDDTYKTIVFPKCSSDLIQKFELLTEKNINKNFKVGYIYFNDQDVRIINDLILIESK
ncbi:MAG: hypothetical protein ACPGSO_02460 [Vicingaceae bacterium]